MNLTKQQVANIAGILGLVIALLSTVLQFIQNQQPVVVEQATPLSASVPCYFDQGGKQFNVGSGCTLSVSTGGTLYMKGNSFTGAVAGFGTDAVNGTMVAHGMNGTPTYPNCMVFNAGFVTVTAQISAANSTSVTLRLFDTSGNPYSGAPVAVRCTAIVVP